MKQQIREWKLHFRDGTEGGLRGSWVPDKALLNTQTKMSNCQTPLGPWWIVEHPNQDEQLPDSPVITWEIINS